MVMTALPLVYAPHPIFKQKAAPVETIDDSIITFIEDLFDTLYLEGAVGMGAPMVGVLKRIAIVDLSPNGVSTPHHFINPEIIASSNDTQTFEEASLCFPYIAAPITRPKAITVRYLDKNGTHRTLEAEGFLASVIQHECDYLDGKVFLDYLSPLKRSMLLKKMQKQIKLAPIHVHGPNCSH